MRVEELLDQFANIEAMIDVLNMDLAEARKKVLAPVQKELDDLEEEFQPKILSAQEKLHELREAITPLVLEHGATIKGQFKQAVFTSGKKAWDSNGLFKYASEHPEIMAYYKPGEPGVSFRKTGK